MSANPPMAQASELPFDLLRAISQIMSSSLDIRGVFDQLMRLLASEVGIERGRLVILDEVSGYLRIEAAHGLSPEMQRQGVYAPGEGITGRVFETGQAIVVPDVRAEPAYLDRTGGLRSSDRPYSFLCLPILSEGRPVGVLSVDKPAETPEALERDFSLLSVVATMISQAIRVHWMLRREKEELIDEVARTRRASGEQHRFSDMIAGSPAMTEVFQVIEQVARTRATVLLLGETGTGKEMIARAIHFNSDRRDKPFVRVNCGALSGTLLESELFGHVKGAFTGAIRDKIGLFQAAYGGTLFLDEIATLDVPLQVKLLRVLQEREFERVGDVQTIRTDVRIVAAANVDLEQEVRERRFREDLFYRLNVVAIRIPPLRERREDIPLLIDHFLDKYNRENGRNLRRLSRNLVNLLVRYPWPGNVRELENAIERAVVLSRDEEFTEELLPPTIRSGGSGRSTPADMETVESLGRRLVTLAIDQEQEGTIWDRVTRGLEREMIIQALARCDGVKIKAADFLGINRNTLNKKYNELGLGDDTMEEGSID